VNLSNGNLFRTKYAAIYTIRHPASLKLIIAKPLTGASKASVVASNQINTLLAILTRPSANSRTSHKFQPAVLTCLCFFVVIEHTYATPNASTLNPPRPKIKATNQEFFQGHCDFTPIPL
jgi:hypothetical protein